MRNRKGTETAGPAHATGRKPDVQRRKRRRHGPDAPWAEDPEGSSTLPTIPKDERRKNMGLNATQQRRRRQRRARTREDRRHGRLAPCLDFDHVFGFQALYRAARECRAGVMWKNTVINFDKRRSLNCVLLAEELAAGTYRKRAPIRFDIHERGKLRHISAVSFRDRVVQRALCDNSLVPIVSGQLIHDNGASLPGKGTAFARRRFELHLGQALVQWERPCMAVFDCSDYFGSIDSTRAFQMIRERYLSIARTEHERRDTERILRILELFVRDEPHLGLGNQTSQTMAVWYLDRADHWAAEKGLYGRYMDDAYCICGSRRQAETVFRGYAKVLRGLGLELNPRKSRIVDCRTETMTFLKRDYAVHDGHVEVRMNAKALRAARRHARNLIRRYDGAHVGLRTVEDSWQSHKATLTGLTHAHGLAEREAEWYRSHCAAKGVVFAP